ncbi:MAG: transketolase [Magnetococcales bacterium]|nr:transketolase [Magnetococcales bacterium]
MPHSNSLDVLACNTLRMLSVDAIEKAKSGHPGMALGAATMVHVLWSRFLKHDPGHPGWLNRDRFVLSAGHASALYYALLHLSGYDLSLDAIKQFRQLGSPTAGHPERGLIPGIEVTTGPLGQGLAMGVGMAMAEQRLARQLNDRAGWPLVDHDTYVLVSDGDLMEGIAHEAVSLAGHLKLGKLICLYDKNNISIEGPTDLTFTENVAMDFAACGWHTITVDDGESIAKIEQAIQLARNETQRPSLIIIQTHIGYGSPKQDSQDCHGAPLGSTAATATRRHFNWPEELFHVPEAVRQFWQPIRERGEQSRKQWQHRLDQGMATNPIVVQACLDRLQGLPNKTWSQTLDAIAFKPGEWATRSVSGSILNAMVQEWPSLWGGSADLGPSVGTDLNNEPERTIHFGVREHAMGAIANGMAAHGGILPYCGTFLSFSNYMIPAIRLAALMQLRVLYLFSHDSIAVGEDGPTHQPVEHLLHLRSIPGMTVLRPGDVWETKLAWKLALELPGPVALILTRQKLPWIDEEPVAVQKGAYIRRDCVGDPELILITSGSELSLVSACHQELTNQGFRVRLVSFPSWELFAKQDKEYQDAVLPPKVTRRLAVEAASPMGWHQWVGLQGHIIAVNHYGISGPFEEVLHHFGFSKNAIMQTAHAMLQDR